MESDISKLDVPEETEEALKAEEVIEEAHEETKVVVIFPARNEGRTIGQCIEMVKNSKYHPNIIVADGYSTDITRDVAEEAGAKVVVSPRRIHPGKGLAMKTGLKVALEENPDVVLFIDSDLENLTSEWVDMLIDGISLDGFDMTRGSYYRAITDAPVTKLVAKRLLWVFFPEISHFDQPLTGEVAAKTEVWKELLKKELPDGWGIDVTMLIETEVLGYRIKEVYLGYKQHRSYRRYSEDPGKLGKMAEQVAIAILKLAKKYGRIDNIDEIQA